MAALQVEGDAVHRLDVADDAAQQAALHREPDLQVLSRHQLGRRRVGGLGPALGLGGQQVAGIVVPGRGENLFRRPLLDDAAAGHDRDPVGHAPDYP